MAVPARVRAAPVRAPIGRPPAPVRLTRRGRKAFVLLTAVAAASVALVAFALTRRPGYNVYEVGDKQISSWRKVLDSNRLNGGQQLYHVAFNNPRLTDGLAAAPEAVATTFARLDSVAETARR